MHLRNFPWILALALVTTIVSNAAFALGPLKRPDCAEMLEAPPVAAAGIHDVSDRIQQAVAKIARDPAPAIQKLRELGYTTAARIVEMHPLIAARIVLNEWPESRIVAVDGNGRSIPLNSQTRVPIGDLEAASLSAPVTLYRGVKVSSRRELLFVLPRDKFFSPSGTSQVLFLTDNSIYAQRYAGNGYELTFELPLGLLYYAPERASGIREIVVDASRFAREGSAAEMVGILKRRGRETSAELVENDPDLFDLGVYDFRAFISDIYEHSTDESFSVEEFQRLTD